MRLTYLLVLVLMIVAISQAKVNNEVTFSDFALNAGDSIEIGSYTIEMVEVQSISDGIVVVRATKAGGALDEERALLENSANSFDGGSDNGGITVTVVAIFDEQSAKIRVEYPKDLGIPRKSTSNRSLRGVEIDKAASKEVAYVYDEGGGHELKNVTAHSGTDVVAYTVSLGEGSSSTSSKISTNGDAIKTDITRKINKLNRPIIKEGSKLIGNISGDRRIDQICSIYEYSVSNWIYKADWKGLEYFQYSNESLEYGQDVNTLGKGDCDDFSILLAALIESVGGTPRIIFAYGPAGGHAFAQVYLGQDVGYNSKASRMVDWLKSKYGVKEVYTFKDEATEDVWLNLDWWKDPKTSKDMVKHPGGPLFNATDFIYAYQDDRENWTALTPVPVLPEAKFSISNANPNAVENVTFDASESRDADTKIKAWNWDFGDGKKGSGQVVTHAYSQGGKYNVTLTVTDDDEVEKNSQSIQTIEVNGLPVPIINYGPKEPKSGKFIDFDASKSYDPDGSIDRYEWEFGDTDTSRQKQPSHIYVTNGTYTISLTVEDNNGAKNATSLKLKVNLPPKAIMQIDSPQPPNQLHNIGDEVKFDASGSIDLDGSIEKWHWDFGDGANSSAERASHIYSKGGELTVRLNVTDDNNASDEYSMNIKVNWLPVPIISIDAINGLEVKFNGSKSFDPEGGPLKYEWDFENDDDIDKKIIAWTNRYPIPDKYSAKLKVIDENGASNSTTITINIENIEKPPSNNISIKINRPNNTELVPVRTIVSGKSRKLEPAEHLWIMVNPYAQINLWWPQEELKPGNDGSWDSRATIGGSPGDIDRSFDIAAIIVDESENKKIKEWSNQGKSGMPWNESWKKQDVVTVKLRAPNVRILSPKNGTVPETFEVNGTSEDPVPGHLWLVVSPYKTPGLWYPQGPNPIKVIAGKWHQIAWIKDADMYSDIAVVLVNEETNKSFTKWHEQGEKTHNWTGLFLPNDTWIGPIIEVIRNQPPIQPIGDPNGASGISFTDLLEMGLNVTYGSQVVIEDNSTYDHVWQATYPDGTIYKQGVGNKFTFTAPPKGDYNELIITLRLESQSGAISYFEASVNLVPKIEIPYIVNGERKSVFVDELPCGIDGSNVVGPDTTSSTYKYTGGSIGKLAYEWTLDGQFVAQNMDATSVSDLNLDWSAISIGAPEEGIFRVVGLSIIKNIITPDGKSIPQRTTCSKTVKVYPPLSFEILGSDIICIGCDPVKTFLYDGPHLDGLSFVWSISGKQVGDNADKVTIDLSNESIVKGYGNHDITLAVTRTTPEGFVIKGIENKTIIIEGLPVPSGYHSN